MALRWFPSLAVWGSALAALAWQWCPVPAVLAAAVVGGLLGVCFAWLLARKPLRLSAVWLVALGGTILVATGAQGLRGARWPARLLDGEIVFLATQCALWGVGSLLLSGALRSTALRQRSAATAEAVGICMVLLGLFSGHRDGFLNRPYFLVDPLWARGIDPMPVFLALGTLIALAALLLAAGHARQRQLDLALLCLAMIAFYALFPATLARRLPGGDDRALEESQEAGNPPIAVLIFRDDYTPASGIYYFRQRVLSRFNGAQLVTAPAEGVDGDLLETWPDQKSQATLSRVDPSLFSSLASRLVLVRPADRPFGLIDLETLTAIGNPDPSRFYRAFETSSRVFVGGVTDLVGRRAGDPNWSEGLQRRYLEAPEDQRYALLVQEILGGLTPEDREDPFKKAIAIKLWLEQEGTYSLDPPVEGSDPVSDFLFGDLTGHAELFARSTVRLLRTAGLPSRLAQGFAVSAAQRGDGSALLLTAGSAHTWAELYLEGLGWMPIDIQPIRTLVPPGDPPDASLQQMLGDLARQTPEEEREGVDPAAARDLQHSLRKGFQRSFLPALAVLLAGLYGVKLWRRFANLWSVGEAAPWTAYRGALDRLAERGLVRVKGESREAFARRCQDASATFAVLTRVYLEYNLGGKAPREREEYSRLLGQVAKELGVGPWWSRWLRALDPISWWRAR